MGKSQGFQELTPGLMIRAVEAATNRKMTGLLSTLPSYINRVYEMQAEDGTRLIAKFYRPGRWTRQAIEEEHAFVSDCARDEIPVIAPLELASGDTLDTVEDVCFAVFPKRWGRAFETNVDEDWLRIGRLVARIHLAGSRKDALHRVHQHPGISTVRDMEHLIENGFVAESTVSTFRQICTKLVEISAGLFDGVESIRIHGDCHRGNLLDRPDEGLMIIDFDDMMKGPPVQDMWMLLPDRAQASRKEFDLMVQGYREFREFDESTFRLIEPLRAMRIIYFLAWCSRQADDYQFRKNFPDWGSEVFWQKEINDLNLQLRVIMEHLQPTDGY